VVKVSMVWRNEDKWEGLPLETFAGQTIEEMLLQIDGREALVEVDIDGKKGYIVGTDAWLEYYREKGRTVYRVEEALERLMVRSPQLLGERIEDPLRVSHLFPGSTVERVELENLGCTK